MACWHHLLKGIYQLQFWLNANIIETSSGYCEKSPFVLIIPSSLTGFYPLATLTSVLHLTDSHQSNKRTNKTSAIPVNPNTPSGGHYTQNYPREIPPVGYIYITIFLSSDPFRIQNSSFLMNKYQNIYQVPLFILSINAAFKCQNKRHRPVETPRERPHRPRGIQG